MCWSAARSPGAHSALPSPSSPLPPPLRRAGEEAFYRPPHHALRHPFIFYYGHVAVFYVNKLRLAGLLPAGPINLRFEQVFEVGVDEVRGAPARLPGSQPAIGVCSHGRAAPRCATAVHSTVSTPS